MGILEDEVEVNLSGSNATYYENKGYIIPRSFDNRGRYRVPRGSKIIIRIEDLPENSHIEVTKNCEIGRAYV